jgi:hypothetical protein
MPNNATTTEMPEYAQSDDFPLEILFQCKIVLDPDKQTTNIFTHM